MGTSKSLSLFTLFLALTATPQAAVALRLTPLIAQSTTVEPVFSLPESVANGTTIKVSSSSTLAGVNEVLEQRFENQYSGTKVELDYTSSDEALAALEQGEVDIAAIGRPLTDDEKAQGYTEVVLGRHKIAIIVSEENAFSGDVTTPQFAQIFRGEITDWSELEGGASGAIRLVDRPDSSDTRQAFRNYPVFKAAPFEVGSTASSVEQDSTEAVLTDLGADGIGFAIADQVVNRPGLRIVTMHKVSPTDPAYPFSQPLSYVYKGDASPEVQAFLGYVTAPDTAGIVDDAKTLGAEATFGGLQGAPNLDPAAVANLVGTPSGEAAVAEPTPEPPAETPAPTPEDTTSQGTDADEGAGATTENGEFPWGLLWLLGIPILGVLLWGLLGRKKDDDAEVSPVAGVDPSIVAGAGAAVAGAGVATAAAGAIAAPKDTNQMVLVPRDSQSAYAYWETSDQSLAKLRQDGGQEFGLRLYDVTSQTPEEALPQPVHQEQFDEQECDRHLTIPTPDRDYVAEVGYNTASDQWLSAARSAPVHVAADLPPFSPVTTTPSGWGKAVDGASGGMSKTANMAKGAAIAGTAAVAAGVAGVASQMGKGSEPKVATADGKTTDTDRVILVPRQGKDAYAYWEISDEKKATLKQQGGENLALRLYDVTGIDPRKQKPHGVQQFACNEQDNDLHVTVPAADRTYLADLGYTTADGKWLRLAHAAPVQVPVAKDDSQSEQPSGNGSGLNLGGMMDGIKAKANDAVQSGKDAVETGTSTVAKMGESVVNTGANAGQALADGTAKTGQAVANTGQSLTTGATNTLKTAVTGAVAAGAAGVTAATAMATQTGVMLGKTSTQDVKIVLVPRSREAAYVYWEMADNVVTELQQKKVETLSLRIHEVTNIELEHSPAHSTQIFECKVTDRDRHIPIPVADKDYLAELGYPQQDGTWVSLACSIHSRVA